MLLTLCATIFQCLPVYTQVSVCDVVCPVWLLQEENRSTVDRQWALCVFDDLIEFAAEVCV